jgi:exopolysaccharide production protein ExoZ
MELSLDLSKHTDDGSAKGTPSPLHRDLIGIQYLRGVASTIVVLFHLLPQLEHLGYTLEIGSGLSGGVDVFFVISGLIMWITTGNSVSPMKFWRHRLVRIVPLYWIATTMMVLVMVFAPSLLQTAQFDLKHILASYAFIAWVHPKTGLMDPVVLPGWTLNYEMFFYFVFGLLLLLRRDRRLVVAIIFFGALSAAGEFLTQGMADKSFGRAQIAFYTSPITLEFVFGMLLGELYTRTSILGMIGRQYGWIIMLIGFGGLLFMADALPGMPQYITRGTPALILVAGTLSQDCAGVVRKYWLPLLAGNASYSLYLTHPFVLSATSQVWRKLMLDTSIVGLWMFAIVSVGSCLIVAAISFQLLEAPLIAYFRRRRR